MLSRARKSLSCLNYGDVISNSLPIYEKHLNNTPTSHVRLITWTNTKRHLLRVNQPLALGAWLRLLPAEEPMRGMERGPQLRANGQLHLPLRQSPWELQKGRGESLGKEGQHHESTLVIGVCSNRAFLFSVFLMLRHPGPC